MSRELNDIREQLGIFSSKYAPVMVMPATVKAVNSDDTCKIEFSNGGTIDDCRLKSVIKDGNKCILVPKVDSTVLVEKIENSEEYFICAVHEITEIVQLIDKVQYGVNNTGFLLKNDDVNMQGLLLELIDDIIAEQHLTNYGPTISLNQVSKQNFLDLKNKVNKLFRNA